MAKDKTNETPPAPPAPPKKDPPKPIEEPGVGLEFTKRSPSRQPGKLERFGDLTQAAKFVSADMAKVVAGSSRDRRTVAELARRFKAEREKATKEAKGAVRK